MVLNNKRFETKTVASYSVLIFEELNIQSQ